MSGFSLAAAASIWVFSTPKPGNSFSPRRLANEWMPPHLIHQRSSSFSPPETEKFPSSTRIRRTSILWCRNLPLPKARRPWASILKRSVSTCRPATMAPCKCLFTTRTSQSSAGNPLCGTPGGYDFPFLLRVVCGWKELRERGCTISAQDMVVHLIPKISRIDSSPFRKRRRRRVLCLEAVLCDELFCLFSDQRKGAVFR